MQVRKGAYRDINQSLVFVDLCGLRGIHDVAKQNRKWERGEHIAGVGAVEMHGPLAHVLLVNPCEILLRARIFLSCPQSTHRITVKEPRRQASDSGRADEGRT